MLARLEFVSLVLQLLLRLARPAPGLLSQLGYAPLQVFEDAFRALLQPLDGLCLATPAHHEDTSRQAGKGENQKTFHQPVLLKAMLGNAATKLNRRRIAEASLD